ncbi:hypothetical protein [Shimia sp.]|uniref:hypothetical protein n=1 Tax=Shimia sp. TaxID=1954381 RepID=UPI003B8C9FFB
MKPIFILTLCALALSACKESCEEIAYKDVQTAVLKRLKSPSTAVFPPVSQIAITGVTQDCQPSVDGYVDAQNGFGGVVRLDYNAKTVLMPDGPRRVFFTRFEQR